MFNPFLSSEFVLIGLIGLATAVAVGVVAFAYTFMPKSDDSWKDPMPSGFRIPVSLMTPLMPLLPISATNRRTTLDKLNHAGLAYAIRPEEMVACRWFGAIVGVACFLVIGPALGLGWQNMVLAALGAVVLGYKYPDISVRDRIKKRQHRIQKDFPFFLDLLLLCLKVGLTFTAAMEHSVNKMRKGPLRDELERTMRDIRTGVQRRDALSRTGDRIGLGAFTNFVGAVNQAEESGAPLVDTLAAQSTQRLNERFQKAEEMANKAPVKLMFPLVIFLLPTTMIIVFFPIAVKFFSSGAGSFFG
ncbi:MAG: type II secretion system F family protein [Halofilum sp. (in: g-proteobacteria)]|nr:type II secretion system F family protein [Halofilum sp. (in: g-proteobacteria)]